MKETYKRALNKTQASQKAKDRAYNLFEEMPDSSKETNITPIKQAKKKRRKSHGVLAASLAFVLSLGAILGTGIISSNNSTSVTPTDGIPNSFILTANAAEITSDNSVSVALDDGAMNFSGGGDEGATHIAYNTIFPLKCEGANIDTVTYSISNSAFQIAYLDNSPVVEGTELESTLNVGSHSPKGHDGQVTYIKQYSSFTLDYDNQESDNFSIDIIGTADLSENDFNVIFGDSYDVEAEVEVTDKLLENTVIDITVKFTDGTTQNEKVSIKCEAQPYVDGPKSGVAACITFSFANSSNTSATPAETADNDFSITVNGETIKKENAASLFGQDSIMSYSGGDYESGDLNVAYYALFPLICSGENIDTITYSITDGAFSAHSLKDDVIISGVELDEPINAGGHYPKNSDPFRNEKINEKQYSSFTVKYNKQTSDNLIIDIVGINELSEADYLTIFGREAAANPDIDAQAEVNKKLLNGAAIDVTIKFTDGSTKTERVNISSEAKFFDDVYKPATFPAVTFSLAQD